jgi:CheY-like chemotaxis protein
MFGLVRKMDQMGKILFIDDNASLLEEISEALKFEGYDVFCASSGTEGIQIARTNKPDLILCDIVMPGLDGFEVYQQLKNDISTSVIPFIFLTALAEHREIRKGMELGADDYLVKPILLKDLLKVVSTRLQKSVEINNQIQIQLGEFRERVLHVLPHEFFTPLNGILGLAGAIKNDAMSISRHEIKEMATRIEANANSLRNLINNYLSDLLITTKNECDVHKKTLSNVHEIISEVSIQVAEEYERVDDLMFKLENAELLIGYDDFAFLIRELVDNAFKFSLPKSKVVVTNTLNDDHVEIQITDYGIGFPINKMSDIGAFNQFSREKQVQQGTGLGLITSMLIVQRYKGNLQITNATLGTKVKLTLPVLSQLLS